MLFQCVQQSGGKTEVPCHELLRILRTVDSRQVKDEICIRAVGIQFLRSGVNIIGVYLKVRGILQPIDLMYPILPVTDVLQCLHQVFSHEAFGSGDQYLHSLCSSLFFS